jgi:hypothetical protein
MKSQTLELRLKAFRLPSLLANNMELAQKAQHDGWGSLQYLESLAELEAEDRRNRRVQMLPFSSLDIFPPELLVYDRFKGFRRLNTRDFPPIDKKGGGASEAELSTLI